MGRPVKYKTDEERREAKNAQQRERYKANPEPKKASSLKYSKKYSKNNKDAINEKRKYQYKNDPEYKKKTVARRVKYVNTFMNRLRSVFNNRKNIADKNNIPFTISFDYALNLFYKTNETCPVYGEEMFFLEHGSGKNLNAPSLDKCIPSLGYIEGNVQWISVKANKHKNDMSPEQIFNQAEYAKKFVKQLTKLGIQYD